MVYRNMCTTPRNSPLHHLLKRHFHYLPSCFLSSLPRFQSFRQTSKIGKRVHNSCQRSICLLVKKSQSRHCCTFKSLEIDNSDGDIYDGWIEVKTRQGRLTDCDIITTA